MARAVVVTPPRATPSSRTLDWALTGPVVVSVAVFLAFAIATLSVVTTAGYDEAIFLDVARSIRATGLPERSVAPDGLMYFEHTPLYPYVLAAVSWAGEEVARGMSLLFGAATVALVAAMVRGHGGIVAGLILAMSPLVVSQSTSIHMEALFMLLVTVSIWLLSRDHVGWAGIVAALAVLTKEFALVYVAVASLYVLRMHGWRMAFMFGVPSAVAMAGWLLWAALIDSQRLADVLARWAGSATGELRNYRTTVTNEAWIGTMVMWVFTPATLLLAAIAAWFVARRRDFTMLPMGYLAAGVALGFAVALKEPRWLIATLPALAIAVGMAIPWTRSRVVAAVVPVVLVSALIVSATIDARRDYDGELATIRVEALLATDDVVHHPGATTVMGWYSGKPYSFEPQ